MFLMKLIVISALLLDLQAIEVFNKLRIGNSCLD